MRELNNKTNGFEKLKKQLMDSYAPRKIDSELILFHFKNLYREYNKIMKASETLEIA